MKQQQVCTKCDTDIITDMYDVISKHEQESITKLLIHWFNESHSITDLDTMISEIKTLEGFKPLGIFQDTYSKEMNFSTFFYDFS